MRSEPAVAKEKISHGGKNKGRLELWTLDALFVVIYLHGTACTITETVPVTPPAVRHQGREGESGNNPRWQ